MQINVTYWLALKIDLLDGVVTGKIGPAWLIGVNRAPYWENYINTTDSWACAMAAIGLQVPVVSTARQGSLA